MYALHASGFYYKSTISFAISLWIHYLFREFILNSLFFSQNHDEFTILFPKLLWMHYFFAKSIWIYYFLRDFTENSSFFFAYSLSVSRIHLESTFLWIDYLIRESTLIKLFFTRYLSKFTICFTYSLLNRYLFREFTLYQKSFSWINYFFRESILNSPSFRELNLNLLFLKLIFYELWLIHVIMTVFLCNRQISLPNHFVIVAVRHMV